MLPVSLLSLFMSMLRVGKVIEGFSASGLFSGLSDSTFSSFFSVSSFKRWNSHSNDLI